MKLGGFSRQHVCRLGRWVLTIDLSFFLSQFKIGWTHMRYMTMIHLFFLDITVKHWKTFDTDAAIRAVKGLRECHELTEVK